MDEKRLKAMIHEEICTYEVCKLAKEKGFDGSKCLWHYNQNGLLRSNRSFSRFDLLIYDLYHHDTPSEVQVYAPTQSLLQRWLREKKGIIVEIIAQPTRSTSKKNCYWWSVKQNSDGFCYQYEECSYLLHSDEGYFDTYELALEDALKSALENLV